MCMPLTSFDIPADFNGSTRYEASLFGSESFFSKLEAFRASLAELDFPDVRVVYTNFALRAILRGLFAIEHHNRFESVFIQMR